MDFARKQLEKYGWKDGEGLGKPGNEGITVPIKPKYKSGKEGMGFRLVDLVDPWWENAYNESLSRVTVQMQATVDSNKKTKSPAKVVVSMNVDDLEAGFGSPAERILKRMVRSNFIDFSKGATLTNGKLEDEKTEARTKSDANQTKDNEQATTSRKRPLTDEELFNACGGRTCHKAARFGYRLSGKLARLAAQEERLNKLSQSKAEEQKPEEVGSS